MAGLIVHARRLLSWHPREGYSTTERARLMGKDGLRQEGKMRKLILAAVLPIVACTTMSDVMTIGPDSRVTGWMLL